MNICKVIMIITLGGFLCLFQNKTLAQEKLLDKKYSLNVKNKELKMVLTELNEITNSILSYRLDIIPKNITVTYKAQNEKLKTILSNVLYGSNLKFVETDKNIVLNLFKSKKKKSIGGIIKEEKSGEVVPGVSVLLYDRLNYYDVLPVTNTVSSNQGFYSLPQIRYGEYYLVVQALGYKTFTSKIKVSDHLNEHFDINLTKKDIYIEEVEVTSELNKLQLKPFGKEKISLDLVKKMSALGGEGDIFKTIQFLPGVKQSSELSSGMYIRGGQPHQNLVLLDGVPIYKPEHVAGFLSAFNTDALLDVDLIKGAAPARFGERISSVLNIKMKDGTKEKFSGTGGVSLISSKIMFEGPLGKNSTFMISGRRTYFDFVTKMINDDMPDYYFYDLNAKFNIQLNKKNRLFLSSFLGRDKVNSVKSDEDYNLGWGNKIASIRWQNITSSNIITNLLFTYSNYDFLSDVNKSPNSYFDINVDTGIKDLRFNLESDYYYSKNSILQVGFVAIKHFYKSGVTLPIDENNFKLSIKAPQESEAMEFAAYIHNEMKLSSKLLSSVGLRGSYYSKGKYLYLEPRLGLNYEFNNNFSANFSAGVSTQNTHLIKRYEINLPTDLYYSSNEKIKPEKAFQTSLGVKYISDDKNYILSLDAYYKEAENMYKYKDDANFSDDSLIEDYLTDGNLYSKGLEFQISKKSGRITGWLAYTYSKTHMQFSELNNGFSFYPTYDNRHSIKIVATYHLSDSWDLGISWVYSSGKSFTLPSSKYYYSPINNDYLGDARYLFQNFHYTGRNNFRLPDFHKLDLSARYYFTWLGLPFDLSLHIYNAYTQMNSHIYFLSKNYNGTILRKVTIFPVIPSFGIGFKF